MSNYSNTKGVDDGFFPEGEDRDRLMNWSGQKHERSGLQNQNSIQRISVWFMNKSRLEREALIIIVFGLVSLAGGAGVTWIILYKFC